MRQYYVYIMTNRSNTVLYTGVTNDLTARVWKHRYGRGSKFVRRYLATKVVYYEVFFDSYNAISREKQLKAGPRRQKLELIERMNPDWRDLLPEI